MKVTINNEVVTVQATTVAALAEERALPEKGIAIAINNALVPRTEWASHVLTEGADIVILKAFCGG